MNMISACSAYLGNNLEAGPAFPWDVCNGDFLSLPKNFRIRAGFCYLLLPGPRTTVRTGDVVSSIFAPLPPLWDE